MQLSWKARAWELARVVGRYVWDFHLRSELAPWKFARRIWSQGPAMRGASGALFVLAIGAGVAGKVAAPSETQRAVLEWTFFALCALAFGTAAGAAAGWGASGFAVLAPWLAYFAIVTASALGGTAWRAAITFPIFALLLVAWRLCVAEQRRGRAAVLWTLFALGAGWVTSGLSGFRAALDLTWQVGGALCGAILAAAGFIAAWARRSRPAFPLSFGRTLALAGGALGAVLALSASQDRALTTSWAASSFPQLDFVVTLFWFWSGAGFGLSLWRVVDWTTRRAFRLGLGRPILIGAPALWVVALAVEYCIVHWHLGQVELRLSAEAHAALTLAAVAAFAWWRLRGRLTARRLLDLEMIWIVAFLALFALNSKATGFAALGPGEKASGLAGAVAFVGVLGIVARAERDWNTTSDRHLGVYVAWAGTFIAILVADLLEPALQLDKQMAVQVFEGMATLGLPLAIHGHLTRGARRAERVPVLANLAWFVLGMLIAFGLMHAESADWRWLVAAIPIWALLLVAGRAIHPSWDRLAGAMAGTMLAAGTTFYWRLPTVFCVPFHPAVPSVEMLTLWYRARPFDLTTELAVTGAGLAAGALCGWVVFVDRSPRAARAQNS